MNKIQKHSVQDKEKQKEHHARQNRLKQVANSIDRGIGATFFGADFHLGFNFMFGEIVALQQEFNRRFSEDIPIDPRFAEFYDRIIQILESSEVVLLDSISPAKNKKMIAAHVARLKQAALENQDKPEKPVLLSKKK